MKLRKFNHILYEMEKRECYCLQYDDINTNK